MKVKWRAHERLLVSSMTVLGIGALTAQYFSRPHLLLPQAGSLLLLYLAYMALNFAVQPAGRWLRIVGVLTQLFALSYILGPVVNFISFYVGAAYKGFEAIPLTFGFHPQPFLNVFGGLNIAIVFVFLYFSYGLFRELIIFQLEKPGPRLAYRVLVSNHATAFAAALLCVPFT